MIGRITVSGTVTEFSLPSAGGSVENSAYDITTGPDGHLWFTQVSLNRVGWETPTGMFGPPINVTEPSNIAFGSDGNLWVTQGFANAITRVPSSGGTTVFHLPPGYITSGTTPGPDGNVWFVVAGQVGRITPGGAITVFPVPSGGADKLATGSDGNLWFTEPLPPLNRIGRMTPSGETTEFPIPTRVSDPTAITDGPDGNVWFTEFSVDQVARITATGQITEYPVPSYGPIGITGGPDGNLWVTSRDSNEILRIVPPATSTPAPTPTPHVQAYVTNQLDGTVSVIDVSANLVTHTIEVQQYPFGPSALATTSTGRFAYVATAGPIQVIDTATNMLVATLALPLANALVVSPNGRVAYATSGSSGVNGVLLIDTGRNVATDYIPLVVPGSAVTPGNLAITPDGRVLYVGASVRAATGEISGALFVVDAVGGAVTQLIPIPDVDHLAVTPDGADLYITNFTRGVSALDTTTNTVVATVPLGLTAGFAIAPNGRFAYATGGHSVFIIDTATRTVSDTIELSPPFLSGVAFTPDSRFAYVIDYGSASNVIVIDTLTKTVITAIPVGSEAANIAMASPPTATAPTPTSTAAPEPCTGDCGGNGTVTVDELVRGTSIALGNAPLVECAQFDTNGDGAVTVEELTQGIRASLDGCW